MKFNSPLILLSIFITKGINGFNFTPLNYLFKKTSILTGVKWPEKKHLSYRLFQNYIQIRNTTIQYPDYYQTQIHTYKNGNLNWKAALECESMYETVFKILHKNKKINRTEEDFKFIKAYSSNKEPVRILDIGCGTGISTKLISKQFPNSLVTGVDLSPYFLSVALYNTEFYSDFDNIDFIHANAENLPFKDNKYDVVHIGYMLHELPSNVIEKVFLEVSRVLKEGGTLAISDLSPLKPENKLIRLFLKIGEPFIKDYYNSMKKLSTILYFSNLSDYKLYYGLDKNTYLYKWCCKKITKNTKNNKN